MNKKDLLTIKEFAKLTGVGPHVLRHYHSLGVLIPAYIDPDTGYRYYSFHQRELVYILQMCVEAGMPLKQFASYMAGDRSVIQYKKLLTDIIHRLEKQAEKLQSLTQRAQMFCNAADAADQIRCSCAPCRVSYRKLNCLMVPISSKSSGSPFRTHANLLARAIPEIDHSKFVGSGLLLKREDGSWKQFLFGIFLDEPAEWVNDSRYFPIPAGEYLCKEVPQSGIEQVWEWSAPYVNAENLDLILETELLVSDYNYVVPPLEQRCLLRKC